MQQTGIFAGRTEVRFPYARWGWTRGGGKVWHGGLDLAGLDDATIRMPYYKGKRITGRVTRARIVTDRRDKTWEWGYYVCVQLDRGQTPDAVNFLYFAHCASLLVKAGQRVASGDALAVMGNTGNLGILFCDPLYGIDHHDNNIGTFHSCDRADDAVAFQFFFDLAFSSQSCSVDKDIFFAVPGNSRINRITCRSGNIGYDTAILPQQSVYD